MGSPFVTPGVTPGVDIGAEISSLPSLPDSGTVSLSPSSSPTWGGSTPLLLLSDSTVVSSRAVGEVLGGGSDAVGEAPDDTEDGLACVGVCPPSIVVNGPITDGADVDKGDPSSLPSALPSEGVDGDPLLLPGLVNEPSVGVFSSVTTGSSDPPGVVGGVRSTDSGDEAGACVTVTAGMGYHPLLSWEMF